MHVASAAIDGRLRPGETSDQHSARLARRYRARLTADAEAVLTREIDKAVARLQALAARIAPPDLSQVIGWSKAGPAKRPAAAGKPSGAAMRKQLTAETSARGRRNAARK